MVAAPVVVLLALVATVVKADDDDDAATLLCAEQQHEAEARIISNVLLQKQTQQFPGATAAGSDLSKKLVFIKTHATGSSTMTSILHRYCEVHHKSCAALPEGMAPGETVMRPVLADLAMRQAGQVDIWPEHATFEFDLFERMMPGSLKVSLFKDPRSRLLSSLARHKNATLLVYTLLFSLQHNVSDWTNCGDGPGEKMSEHVPLDAIDNLDLVMLTEKYELSLVLLARKMGWSLPDLLYLRHMDHSSNADLQKALAAMREYFGQKEETFTYATKQMLRECTEGVESDVYAKAKDVFDKQWHSLARSEQEQVQTDVARLKTALMVLEDCCTGHVNDAFCSQLHENNVEWNKRQRFGRLPPANADSSFCRRRALKELS